MLYQAFLPGVLTSLLVVIATWHLNAASRLATGDVVVVVLSQGGSYYGVQASNLRADIEAQAQALSEISPVVHLVHEDFPHPGAWTVLPILNRLNSLHSSNCSWLVFCESHTRLNLTLLLDLLSRHDHHQEMWLGHALYDREPTIIHHFAFAHDPSVFKYPHFASGFIISTTLLNRLSSRLSHGREISIDFSIDVSHELALFIWDNGKGALLQHSALLCLREEPQCATYPVSQHSCGDAVPTESIYFAVKTCSKFHRDRIPVVKNTWARHAVHIGYYSEVQDDLIPTIDLGVANTEHGHCGKTLGILRAVASLAPSLPAVQWVVVADDDTLLSVARLRQLLSCFKPEQPLALGERYGYNVQSPQGYNYITGGGGMVFSLAVVRSLVQSGQCECPANSTPDDMFLGVCLARIAVNITHSPRFHQARPLDYAPEYLAPQQPVSFHKHWMIDPINVYNTWFTEPDRSSDKIGGHLKHTEL